MANTTFSKGDKVRLGDGREGVIVGKRERAGFYGFIVKITRSVDENQVGQTVAATGTTMKKISQTMPGIVISGQPDTETSVEDVPDIKKDDIEKQKEMHKKDLQYTQKQIQMLQTKVNDLQQLVAQTSPNPNQPAGSSMEELDRIDQADEQNVQQQQDNDLAQQEMQQEKMLQDQRMRQEQQMQNMQTQMMQSVASAHWVKPEIANIKIAVKNIELTCDVAATPRQQASGLQSYASLDNNRGLWFPFTNKRIASFHMGEVKFPIDIIFVDDSKINKIVSNVQPRQVGSWKSICTDVVEVNGGWCRQNNIKVGDIISTPLTGKKRASYSEIEKLVNTSWSGPQDARVSDKESTATSYDTLRTITTAEGEDDFEARMLATFPFLKEAQIDHMSKIYSMLSPLDTIFDQTNNAYRIYNEMRDDLRSLDDVINGYGDYTQETINLRIESALNYADDMLAAMQGNDQAVQHLAAVKDYLEQLRNNPPEPIPNKLAQEHRQPDTTDRRDPGEVDRRNPETRFKHNTLPDSSNPFGDGDPRHVDPLEAISNSPKEQDGSFTNGYGKHFDYQRGWWPSPKTEHLQEGVPIRPAQRVDLDNFKEDNVDMVKLANGSLTLFDRYGPEWSDYDGGEEYEGDPGYAKIAIINDNLLSNWIDSLGFDSDSENKLRETMFTDSYKVMLGDALVASNKISNYEIFDSDLLLYQ